MYIIGITAQLLISIMLCALLFFIPKWRDLQFNVDSEGHFLFLRKSFMAGLFTLRVFARNLLRGNCRRNIFFLFRFNVQPIIRTWALRLRGQHTTYQTTATLFHISNFYKFHVIIKFMFKYVTFFLTEWLTVGLKYKDKTNLINKL